MKHIKIIKDEQLLEQISGGRALAVAATTCRSPIRALAAKFVMELRSIIHPKDRVATYSKV